MPVETSFEAPFTGFTTKTQQTTKKATTASVKTGMLFIVVVAYNNTTQLKRNLYAS